MKIWSKQWFPLLSSTLNINNFLYNGTNWFKFSTFFCLQLPSLYLIAKKKKEKKEKSGCFSWMLCTLLSGLSDFQLDPRGRNQGFYNVVCQRMFLFCKSQGLIIFYFMTLKSVIYRRFLFMAYLNLWISRCLTNLIFRKHEKINSPFSIVDLFLFHARWKTSLYANECI